ncbi:hypothetical protein RHMOL_Rhmol11G0098700 [Rhododendron molle]|uniref:Uncharacterized protein n=1 Tax=Rhododendron molle TaxID=49168 RepID=A0ACC0LQE8_RHOML|nr:hypothetical protein RHMOL_Rhmol11G0098700 [Rhododendron molle]
MGRGLYVVMGFHVGHFIAIREQVKMGQGKSYRSRKKRGTSTTQTLRKSQRIQKEGGSPNGATSYLPTEPIANHAEGMSGTVAQPSELPTSPTDETNQHSSLPNVGGSTGGFQIALIFGECAYAACRGFLPENLAWEIF